MRVIKLKNSESKLEVTSSEDILFSVDSKTVDSNIKLSIRVSDSKINVSLYFISDKRSNVKIYVLTTIPTSSVNNVINISLNALMISDECMIELSPAFELLNNSTVVEHSTVIGAINEKWKRYLGSRGLNDQDINKLFVDSYTR